MEKEGEKHLKHKFIFSPRMASNFLYATGIESKVSVKNSSLKYFRMGAEYLGEHLYVKQGLEMQFNTSGALGRDKCFSFHTSKKGVQCSHPV